MVLLLPAAVFFVLNLLTTDGLEALNPKYETVVIDGNYSTNITVTVNANKEYIIHFQDSPSQFPYIVFASSNESDVDFPVFIMVRQQKEATSWEIPLLVKSRGGLLSFRKTSRTLCHNNIDIVTELFQNTTFGGYLSMQKYGLHKRLTMSVSTASEIPTNVTVRVEEQTDFYLKRNRNHSVTISPSEPRYFYYKYPEREETDLLGTVILEIDSVDETCFTVSIQNATCPVFDLNEDISYEGEFETVNTKGGIIIREKEYPNGFFVVFVSKGDNYDCDQKNTVLPFQNTRKVMPSNRSSVVTFRIRSNISKDAYLVVSLLTISLLLGFYVVFGVISCEFCLSEKRRKVATIYEPLVNEKEPESGCSNKKESEPGRSNERGRKLFEPLLNKASTSESTQALIHDRPGSREDTEVQSNTTDYSIKPLNKMYRSIEGQTGFEEITNELPSKGGESTQALIHIYPGSREDTEVQSNATDDSIKPLNEMYRSMEGQTGFEEITNELPPQGGIDNLSQISEQRSMYSTGAAKRADLDRIQDGSLDLLETVYLSVEEQTSPKETTNMLSSGANTDNTQIPDQQSMTSVATTQISDAQKILLSPTLYVSDLATKEPKHIRRESLNYFLHLISIGIFYAVPVVQLAVTHQRLVFVTGDLDTCYYNFLCAHPYLGANDYNHIFSNVGYIALGILFTIIARRHKRLRHDDDLGIPMHYGLFYAMGTALALEGVLSACYHICPSQSNFQFDTSFMYVMAVLCIIKLYQNRHSDINATAYVTFLILAVTILIAVVGILNRHAYIWALFIFSYCLWSIFVGIKIYFVNRCTEGRKLFKEKMKSSGIIEAIKPIKKDRYKAVVVAVILNIIAANLGFVCSSSNVDFGTFLLGLLGGNAIMYTAFYVYMKWKHDEKIGKLSIVYLVLAAVLWGFAITCFLKSSTQWMLTPAESRQWNMPCVVMDFYDYHDIWHLLSAPALFFTFMVSRQLGADS